MITTPLTKIVKKNNISFRKKSERVTKQQDFLINPNHVVSIFITVIRVHLTLRYGTSTVFFSANKI